MLYAYARNTVCHNITVQVLKIAATFSIRKARNCLSNNWSSRTCGLKTIIWMESTIELRYSYWGRSINGFVCTPHHLVVMMFNAVLMLSQHLRSWANIKRTLAPCPMFGMAYIHYSDTTWRNKKVKIADLTLWTLTMHLSIILHLWKQT